MEDLQKLQGELNEWKEKCKQANNQKIANNLLKLDAENKQEELQKEMEAVEAKKKKVQEALRDQQKRFADELLELQMKHSDLMEEEAEVKKRLDKSENAFRKIQDYLMINTQLPDKNINFRGILASAENQSDSEPMDITYTCHIISSHPCVLGAGQALVTFEDEQVAESIVAKKKHDLNINGTRVTAEALQPDLQKSVKFEVNMNISRSELNISNLPVNIPEEIIKDKVELAFYKPSIGGAEIKKVDYNRNDNTARITYVENGVPQRVLKRDRHQLLAEGATVEVSPCVDIELNKLQIFSAVSSRSVQLTGIRNVDDQDEDDVQDAIEIHFQKESNGGGEVESTVFSQGRRIPIFEEDLK